jgi:branched-chain amino acid transport system permease protein
MLDNLSILIQAPVFAIDLVLQGIFIGAIFALAAYGLALVWGVMNVKNLCQGEYVILGGYVALSMSQMGIHPIFALPVAFVGMFIFGWIIYLLIISRVVSRDMFTSLLATFGLSLLIQQGLNLYYGPEVQTAQSNFGTIDLFDEAVTIPVIRLVSLALVAAMATGIILFMRFSRIGQAIRATSQDARAARVLGINTDRVYAFTYALNAAICGATGVLVSMIWVIQPYYGIVYSIRAFVIVTAAGLGNLPGVIMAGFGLGLAEKFADFIFGAEFAIAAVVSMLVIVLIIRQIQMARIRQAVK